ncbi:MAG: tetratricopeptide repeat protein [Cyanobacteria bacterium Co-bin8]|nr:tetratricopeptide repeat protein [Cyanobacteria bacterium Co-bin8]
MKDRHWLRLAEYSLLAGSGAGTIASVATQNIAFASAPLTAVVALGLLSRNRLEQRLSEADQTLLQQNRLIARKVINLSKQVTALPSPEALTNFQRSVMDRNDRSFFRFSKELQSLQQDVEQRLTSLEMPDLSQINQDICRLQDHYVYLTASLESLTSYIQRLSTLPRVEAAESQISVLKTEVMQMRVTLETLGSETKTTVSHLQDTIHHVDRRLRQLPVTLDPQHLKEEVQELIKAVSGLVPRHEFDNLVTRLQELSQQQTTLNHALKRLRTGSQPVQPVGENTFQMEFIAASLEAEMERLSASLEHVEQHLQEGKDPAHLQAELQRLATTYTETWEGKLSQLEALTGQLQTQQQLLLQQIEQGAAPAQELLSQLASRLNWTEEALQGLSSQFSAGSPLATVDPAQSQWIIDFPGTSDSSLSTSRNASRRALEAALDWAHHRLLLVWPWSADLELDDALVYRFRQVLARQCHLEIGWCHRGNRQEGRLVRAISLRWGTESAQIKTLKAALNRLMPLRQSYPDRFRFKILGSDESFLVCDRTLAILGLQGLQTRTSVFPDLDLKLQTTDPEVVQALAERFENPVIAATDAAAFFNRGTTRYDLRDQPGAIADYTQVLSIEPENGVAYNNRGVALVDLGQIDDAEEDFSQAIALCPDLLAAYCNRGWLRLEKNRYQAAVADFSRAIELDPQSPMSYLYRGSAIQKLGDLSGAIEDYDRAVEWSDETALPYFFRSAAYDKQGDRQQAIADLEKAQHQLQTQGDQQILPTVQRTLSKLKQTPADGAALNGSSPY